MDSSLTFAHTGWLWFLLSLVPVLILRLRSVGLRSSAIGKLVAPKLRARLVSGTSGNVERWTRYGLQVTAFALLIFALARPQFGVEREFSSSSGRNIIIALDTSRSMLASDLEPSRLVRAKLAAQDLIEALPSDRIGLIAFAGSCFLQAPLTIDHEAVVESIQQLDTNVIPRGGTNVSRAITLAAETFINAETSNNAIILFSDGEDLEGATGREAALSKAQEASMTIVTVGVGTPSGAIVPDPDSPGGAEFVRDREGKIVRSRLDDSLLRNLATASDGLYLNLNTADTTRDIVAKAIDRIERSEIETKAIETPIDRYRWPLALAILLFAISIIPWPKGSFLKIASISPRSASVLIFLSSTGIISAVGMVGEEALEEYNAGNYERALASYHKALEGAWLKSNRAQLEFGRGSAAYQIGDYRQAAKALGEALRLGNSQIQEDAHYNLGNALYREGEALLESPQDALRQWKDAAEHYRSALDLNSENKEAAHNLEVVESRIKELDRQQSQEQSPNEQPGSESQDQGQDEEREGSGTQVDNNDPEEQQQSQTSTQNQEKSEATQNTEGPQEEQRGDEMDQEAREASQIPDGEVSAQDEGEERQEGKQDQRPADAAYEEPHPETGYTPSEARAILRRYSGEDLDVKPLLPRNYEPVIKNW